MTFPMFYYPFAIIWFGFSKLLGTIVSKIILAIVYLIMLIPIGVLRRMMGKDSLRLKQFKKSGTSVMNERNHRFTSDDIVNPY